MDTSKVRLMRSAKGNDMLCVDNFLYHFVNCGRKCCRWACNKRKDKQMPCRSRIATAIVDNDETKHKVVKISGEHTHDRCSEREIFKVQERKRLSDLAGEPCTVAKKVQERLQECEEVKSTSSQFGYDDSEESDEWPADDDINEMFPKKPKLELKSHDMRSSEQIFDFERQKLYMLKTSLGRQMICVDGFLYRLESKSITTTTHRWECIKQSDNPCRVRILTECLSDGSHRLKTSQNVLHKHDPYTPTKLHKLLQKNNIAVIGSNEQKYTTNPRDSHDFEEVTLETSTPIQPPKKRIMAKLNLSSPVKTSQKSVENTKKPRTKATRVTYTYTEDPLSALSTDVKTNLDKTKFTFLPSAKGNKVLCLDNFIYHLDSRSPRNGRGYWTCLLRRDKTFKCNARVTTEMTANGPEIVRVSGTHLHPDNTSNIKRRLCRSLITEKAGKAGLDPSQILEDIELKSEAKEIVKESKEAIKKRITRESNKNKNFTEDSVSSFSSLSDTEDHLNYSNELPTKLEEMCTGTTKTYEEQESEAKTETIFDANYEDLVEEMIMEDTMEVEYLDPTGYVNEDCIMEEVPNEDNHLKDDKYNSDASITEDYEMNIDNVTKLRSAKGGDLLCVDGYIYHTKSSQNNRTYWSCIKCRDPILNCKSRVTTITDGDDIRVYRTTNQHSHPVFEADIKRRLYNEVRGETTLNVTPYNILNQPLDKINNKYTKILSKHSKHQEVDKVTMKLYAVSDGPPSLAVRMALKALKIQYELISVDYIAAEHMTEEYAKMNPQKEIPVLDDDGFFLPESIAIMQYLCDKYAANTELYPRDATKRAVVNHRLCFNMGFYYSAISAHSMAPIFFDYQRTDMSLKKVKNALNVFENYLIRSGTKYAAGNTLTIADFALVASTLCLEAINFDISSFPLVEKWYETFKEEYPELWEIANEGMQEIIEFEKNPPDLSHMNHPFHPTRKITE